MNKETPFPSNEPEQEIIYLEVLPERDPQPVIRMKRISSEGISERELTAW